MDKTKHTIHTKAIIFGMVLVFLLVHMGFYATYIRHFPAFHDFNWVHHVHGALMGAWVMLLVIQPILIQKRLYSVHRLSVKLTFILIPVLLLFMILIARENYCTGIINATSEEVFAKQSNTWMQIILFVLFISHYFQKAFFCPCTIYIWYSHSDGRPADGSNHFDQLG